MTIEDYQPISEARIVNDDVAGVTHDEAMDFAESYNKGWKEVEDKWGGVIALGMLLAIFGLVIGYFEILPGILLVIAGIIAIIYGFDKLKHVKVAKNFMLETNIRIRAKK